MSRRTTIKAIPCTQNGKTFYTAIISSAILKETCFISRRDENVAAGFQRTLNENRAKNIAKYLDDGKGCIPSSLILSAQDIAKFSFDANTSEISFKNNEKSFMILDGQHRLFGFIQTKDIYFIPVVIFTGLKISEEVNLFIDINTNQKGVPATLLLDIKNLAGKDSSLEEKQRILFDYLNENSVLAGLLSASKSKVGFISRVTFNEATKNLFENGYFANKDIEIIKKGVKNYLEAVDLIFNESRSEKAKLTTGSLFKAVFAIFNECVDKTIDRSQNLKVDSIKSVLSPISSLNYDSYVGSSNAVYMKITNDMKTQLNEYNSKYCTIDEDTIF